MSRRHVLITGGAGYIGSHTVVELLAASRTGPIDYVPVIVDNLCNSCEGRKGLGSHTNQGPQFQPVFELFELQIRTKIIVL